MSVEGGSQDYHQYIEMRGHKYHPSGKNYLPSDESEHERTQFQHRMYKMVLDGQLLTSKLTGNIKTVVDVGPGPTGIWIKEFAQAYPEMQITGLDIEPIQHCGDLPKNIKLVVQDAEEPWDIEEGSVDFVHVREITQGVRDWSAVLAQAFRALRPGGLLEMSDTRQRVFDFDGTFGETVPMLSVEKVIHDMAEAIGIDLDPVPNLPHWLDYVGFERVAQRTEILPVGDWAKDEKLKRRAEVFADLLVNHYGYENRVARLFATVGRPPEQFEATLKRVQKEVMTSEFKMYGTIVFTTAKKP